MASYLITGSSRGLGFCLAKQLASRPASEVSIVFATARSDSSETLKELVRSSNGRVVFVKLDTAHQDSVGRAAKEIEAALGEKPLDVLINNAGITPGNPEEAHTMENLDEVLHTNVTGTHMVSSTFLPLIRKGPRRVIVNMSSTVGSFGFSKKFGVLPCPAYKISKAAQNMLTIQYANSLEKEKFTVISVSPGWLRTDGGGEGADLSVDTGAEGVLKIIDNLDKDSNGKFLDIHVPGMENNPGLNQYPGGEAPW